MVCSYNELHTSYNQLHRKSMLLHRCLKKYQVVITSKLRRTRTVSWSASMLRIVPNGKCWITGNLPKTWKQNIQIKLYTPLWLMQTIHLWAHTLMGKNISIHEYQVCNPLGPCTTTIPQPCTSWWGRNWLCSTLGHYWSPTVCWNVQQRDLSWPKQ